MRTSTSGSNEPHIGETQVAIAHQPLADAENERLLDLLFAPTSEDEQGDQ